MEKLVRIKEAKCLERFRVRLEFTDGTIKELDLEPYLHGPVFEALKKDPSSFRSLKVDNRMGTIVWDNGADIDPDVLYHGWEPEWVSVEKSVEGESARN